jgi:SAM-dependent methyltransferase
MTLPTASRLDHFEALYAASDDPWDVRGAPYEQRKRALLLAALRRARYRSVFEPGCGNGEMSAALALRCDRLLACDGSPSAVAAARRRVTRVHGGAVRVEERRLPAQWPAAERFDLVVMSELAYYFSAADVRDLLARACATLAPDGELVLCHYLHAFDDRVTATETVHALADAMPGLVRTLHCRDADFLLEAWRVAGAAA